MIENHDPRSLEPLNKILSLTHPFPAIGPLSTTWPYPSPFLTPLWSLINLSPDNLHYSSFMMVSNSSYFDDTQSFSPPLTPFLLHIFFDSNLETVLFLQNLLLLPSGFCYFILATIIIVVLLVGCWKTQLWLGLCGWKELLALA